ncbi:hypothetical protein CBL_03328 [Carabus blaptoides fortunei]
MTDRVPVEENELHGAGLVSLHPQGSDGEVGEVVATPAPYWLEHTEPTVGPRERPPPVTVASVPSGLLVLTKLCLCKANSCGISLSHKYIGFAELKLAWPFHRQLRLYSNKKQSRRPNSGQIMLLCCNWETFGGYLKTECSRTQHNGK